MNPDVTLFSVKLDGLYEQINKVKDNQEKHSQTLDELKEHLSSFFNKHVDQISSVTSIDELMTTSGSMTASIINEP